MNSLFVDNLQLLNNTDLVEIPLNETDKIIDVKIMNNYLFTLIEDLVEKIVFETVYILNDVGQPSP